MPCVPTMVSVSPDCISNTAVVSWSASKGAVQYSVSAWSSQGNATCRSSDLNCTLNITCGSNYTLAVKAIHGNCSSPPSETLTFSSGNTWRTSFCIHTKIKNSVMLIWPFGSKLSSRRCKCHEWIQVMAGMNE